ncbi:hypothetical protein ES695_16290 [Candidatus Atribacteria bacterium 1244-E10-H5-B2]|nr:MAG: hypothetical protein ES695_16290 [Candidatus Atribacteria bacterium 1244-E10-H5-B2]
MSKNYKITKEVQTIQITKINKKIYHSKFESAIINVSEGLYDRCGRKVTEVSIIPDDGFLGEPVWHLLGQSNNRIVQLKNLKARWLDENNKKKRIKRVG